MSFLCPLIVMRYYHVAHGAERDSGVSSVFIDDNAFARNVDVGFGRRFRNDPDPLGSDIIKVES